MDLCGGKEGGELALVGREVRGIEVAEVDGARALGGELVSCRAANAEEGVCAWDDLGDGRSLLVWGWRTGDDADLVF